jgi:hypothetical protein
MIAERPVERQFLMPDDLADPALVRTTNLDSHWQTAGFLANF